MIIVFTLINEKTPLIPFFGTRGGRKAAVPLSFFPCMHFFAPGRTFPLSPLPGLSADDPGSLKDRSTVLFPFNAMSMGYFTLKPCFCQGKPVEFFSTIL